MAVRVRRYNHNRSNTRITSYNMAEIVPTVSRHCIAGTTVRGGVQAGIQLASMARQALSSIRTDTFAIAGYDRILWDDAEDFYTGGETGDVRPTPPYIVAPADTGWLPGSLADHLGYATGIPGLKCNALPFRLYAMWINEHVIDPNIQEKLPVSTASGLDETTNTELWHMNWPKDIFTTAVVEEQLGDEVVIPLATSAPVVGNGNAIGLSYDSSTRFLNYGSTTNPLDKTLHLSSFPSYPPEIGDKGGTIYTNNTNGTTPYEGNAVGLTTDKNQSGIYADLTNASGILPSDFNMAMARQAWKTKRNLYGHRFRDWLAYLGIRYSDRRLQLPETLAHGRAMIDVNGVLQTAPGDSSYVGQRGGTATGYGSCSYKTYFEEPATVIHLVCVRPAPLYVNIQPMEWMFDVREDIYTPEFAHVGMAEIKKGVLFPTGNVEEDNQRWGYYNRYDEYRSALNDVSGAMKTTNLVYHQGRVFSSAPELNSDFLECNPSPRIFNDMENSPHIEACVVRNTFIERNMVSPNGNPRFR